MVNAIMMSAVAS